MGFLDKAKGLADQAMAKADQAMAGGPTSKSADPYFRDLGVLAYLEATGRAPAEIDRLRQETMTAIQGLEGQTALNFAMSSAAPPPPGAAASAPPPPQHPRPWRSSSPP
ncbi:MAG TPA: hypothetical protein PLN09_14775, partial [Microthrixaceae bacterium]|nr:hypothetical protein [Microthrixaceae bacterium]